MKILILALLISTTARADWHDYVAKASCGCWKTTVSFFNADEAHPFSVEKLGERSDGSAMLLARFKGEAKMDSPAGKFHFKSFNDQANLLVLTFNQAGWIVASKTYPLDSKDTSFAGPFRLEFITNAEVAVGSGSLTYQFQPNKRYLYVLSYETGEFLPTYSLKFFGRTDLSISGILPLPDGDLILTGGYMGFGHDRYALFLQPGGMNAISLFNFSSDDDFGADLYLARINQAGETKWAKEIWSRFYSAPAVSLESPKDGTVELSFNPNTDSAVFEPRHQAKTLKGNGTFQASYSWDGDFIDAKSVLIPHDR